MILDRPVPFREAVSALENRDLVPSTMTSYDWDQVHADIRERSFFSAEVTRSQVLVEMKTRLQKVVSPENRAAGDYMNKARFRQEIRDYLDSIGYSPDGKDVGTIKDLRSEARLNVIYRTNVEMAQGLGRSLQANDPAVLLAFPCQELFRLQSRKEPRDWPSRWQQAGGKIFSGRMIALKDDPIWSKISRFNNPYPPFDFNSGMWVRPVSRREAVRLGVIEKDKQVAKPLRRSWNSGVQSTVPKSMNKALEARIAAQGEGRLKMENGILRMVSAGAALQDLQQTAAAGDMRRRVRVAPVPADWELPRAGMNAASIVVLAQHIGKLLNPRSTSSGLESETIASLAAIAKFFPVPPSVSRTSETAQPKTYKLSSEGRTIIMQEAGKNRWAVLSVQRRRGK